MMVSSKAIDRLDRQTRWRTEDGWMEERKPRERGGGMWDDGYGREMIGRVET